MCLDFLSPSLCWLFVFMLVQPYDLNVAAAAPGITSAFKARRRKMVPMTFSPLIRKSKAFNLTVERCNKQVEMQKEGRKDRREGGRGSGDGREGGNKEGLHLRGFPNIFLKRIESHGQF